MRRRTESWGSKLWHKRRDFRGTRPTLRNRVVKHFVEADDKKALNQYKERKELYHKLKEYSGKRGVTEPELRMALAELKYGHDDSLTRKEADTIAKELGVKVTKRDYFRAKEYKDRTGEGKDSAAGTGETVMRAKRAEEIIAKRRAARGRHKDEYDPEDLSHRGITKKDREKRRTRGRHKRSAPTSRTKTLSERGASKNLLEPTGPGFRSRLRTAPALDRLQRGGRSRYGASHETMRRTNQYDRLGRLTSRPTQKRDEDSRTSQG